jgi:predicted amidohydrolase
MIGLDANLLCNRTNYHLADAMSSESVKYYLESGVILAKSGKIQDALDNFDEVLKVRTKTKDAIERNEALFNRGVCLGILKKHEEAVKCFEKIQETNPLDKDSMYNKGVALGKLGRIEEEFKCYKTVLDIDPNDEDAPFDVNFPDKEYRWKKEPADKQPKIVHIIGSPEKRDWVRVGVVQLSYELQRGPSEGWKQPDSSITKNKVIAALKIAQRENVDIICFPELSVEKEWVEDVTGLFRDMIIVFGSYYENGYNVCPVIIPHQDSVVCPASVLRRTIGQSDVYEVRKINPAPRIEKRLESGMKRGEEVPIFETEYGNFVVLICWDFVCLGSKITEELVKKDVDFVFVPSYSTNTKILQMQGEVVCQVGPNPFVLISSALVEGKKSGESCIIGVENDITIANLSQKRYTDRNQRYKLLKGKSKRDCIILASLNIRKKEVIPQGANDEKIKEIKRYMLS